MIKERYTETKTYQLNGRASFVRQSIHSYDINPLARMVEIFKPIYDKKGSHFTKNIIFAV